MGITENLGGGPTDPFELGMLETAAANLNDRPEDTWLPEFRKEIHCLIFVTGDCQETVDETLTKIKQILAHTVKQIKLVEGKVRPGDQEAHEQFVFPLSNTLFITDTCVKVSATEMVCPSPQFRAWIRSCFQGKQSRESR
jgi:hypothetical protein